MLSLGRTKTFLSNLQESFLTGSTRNTYNLSNVSLARQGGGTKLGGSEAFIFGWLECKIAG